MTSFEISFRIFQSSLHGIFSAYRFTLVTHFRFISFRQGLAHLLPLYDSNAIDFVSLRVVMGSVLCTYSEELKSFRVTRGAQHVASLASQSVCVSYAVRRPRNQSWACQWITTHPFLAVLSPFNSDFCIIAEIVDFRSIPQRTPSQKGCKQPFVLKPLR